MLKVIKKRTNTNLEPSLLEQANLLSDLCALTAKANSIGDKFAAEILDISFEVLKQRIALEGTQRAVNDRELIHVVKKALLSLLCNRNDQKIAPIWMQMIKDCHH